MWRQLFKQEIFLVRPGEWIDPGEQRSGITIEARVSFRWPSGVGEGRVSVHDWGEKDKSKQEMVSAEFIVCVWWGVKGGRRGQIKEDEVGVGSERNNNPLT